MKNRKEVIMTKENLDTEKIEISVQENLEQQPDVPPKNEKKKMSKKKKATIISLSSLAVLTLAGTLLFIFRPQDEQAADTTPQTVQTAPPVTEESAAESAPESSPAPAPTTPELSQPANPFPQSINLEEIRQGNFASLRGIWTNPNNPHLIAQISGNSVILGGQLYNLQVSEHTQPGNLPVLLLHAATGENVLGVPLLAIFPRGVAIPVAMEEGMDTTGAHDPTDRGRDRILFSQGNLNSEQLARDVLYRD